MRVLGWLAIYAMGGFLLILIVNFYSESRLTAEDYARRNAKECVEAWTEKYVSQGYSAADTQVGAVLHCTEELQALKRYQKQDSK